ncbi:MAG: ATP synthase F1 subunit epsilon [Candidatus Pacebacteria bacterium]|nr:ATP synthase F1 subunit epsilon [Candidatus Paceibacterota bacterium]MBP9839828.1 ATP synthase F1 subunit epsilon [Candidatus Paceibacterota bacterium]MDQ5922599.1 F-type H+-transporting ATPase subunit epsilon [Patescibacteria group bacterium]
MSKKLKLKIITPEKLILEEMVDSVTVPTKQGEITILPDHVPLISEMSSGEIVAMSDSESIPMAVVGGFVEIKKDQDNTVCAILADFAEHVVDITQDAIDKAKTRAEELRKQMENKEVVDFERLTTELERSLTRVKIADKWKNRKYKNVKI